MKSDPRWDDSQNYALSFFELINRNDESSMLISFSFMKTLLSVCCFSSFCLFYLIFVSYHLILLMIILLYFTSLECRWEFLHWSNNHWADCHSTAEFHCQLLSNKQWPQYKFSQSSIDQFFLCCGYFVLRFGSFSPAH